MKTELLRAVQDTYLTEEDTSYILLDYDVLERRIEEVRVAFPPHWLHSVAQKTNPLRHSLAFIASQGFGIEAASYGEFSQAADLPTPFIVWDSPVKTKAEIDLVHRSKKRVYINANSLEELQELRPSAHIEIGLRINPMANTSAHPSMSVSSPLSKFGEPITNRVQIASYFRNSSHPIGLHVHASSQNMETTETIDAIRSVYELAEEIGWQHIAYFDVGGGFPVAYDGGPNPSMQDFAEGVIKACPKLANEQLPVITEFGRYYHAHAGSALSRVHSVKRSETEQCIIHHLGADCFLRESYQPELWPHRVKLFSAAFQEHLGDTLASDLAGPLCFGGDYLMKGVALPPANPGDWLLIQDVGANSFALWSMHCSRAFPKVLAQHRGMLSVAKERQSLEEVVDFWN